MTVAAELARQQALLKALRDTTRATLPIAAVPLPGRAADRPADKLAGVQAYRANAQAIAERALVAAYPVLARLVGDETMAALARDLWRQHPPVRGDLAWFGGELADWLATVHELSDVPYLPDVARLEWAVHRAHAAADPPDAPHDLQMLAQVDPSEVGVRFVEGSTGVASAWPIVTLWQVHQVPADEAPNLDAARAALAAGQGEAAWVWRRGHRVEVAGLTLAEHEFNAELLAGRSLGLALEGASTHHADFSFEPWLLRALRDGWLAGLKRSNSKP
jgi:hypothetical protein